MNAIYDKHTSGWLAYEAQGRILRLATGLIVVPFKWHGGSWDCVVAEGNQTYPRGGYNIVVPDQQLLAAEELLPTSAEPEQQPAAWPDLERLNDRIVQVLAQGFKPGKDDVDPADAHMYVYRADHFPGAGMHCPPTPREAGAVVMAELGPVWEGLTNRAEAAEQRAASYEDALNWGTSCLGCAKGANKHYAEYVRADKAEAALKQVRPGIERLLAAKAELIDNYAGIPLAKRAELWEAVHASAESLLAVLDSPAEPEDRAQERQCAVDAESEVARLRAGIAKHRRFLDEDYRQWCSPDGVAAHYAQRLIEHLDEVISAAAVCGVTDSGMFGKVLGPCVATGDHEFHDDGRGCTWTNLVIDHQAEADPDDVDQFIAEQMARPAFAAAYRRAEVHAAVRKHLPTSLHGECADAITDDVTALQGPATHPDLDSLRARIAENEPAECPEDDPVLIDLCRKITERLCWTVTYASRVGDITHSVLPWLTNERAISRGLERERDDLQARYDRLRTAWASARIGRAATRKRLRYAESVSRTLGDEKRAYRARATALTEQVEAERIERERLRVSHQKAWDLAKRWIERKPGELPEPIATALAEAGAELLAALTLPDGRPGCSDPIECGHEAALGQAEEELERLRADVRNARAAASTSDAACNAAKAERAALATNLLAVKATATKWMVTPGREAIAGELLGIAEIVDGVLARSTDPAGAPLIRAETENAALHVAIARLRHIVKRPRSSVGRSVLDYVRADDLRGILADLDQAEAKS